MSWHNFKGKYSSTVNKNVEGLKYITTSVLISSAYHTQCMYTVWVLFVWRKKGKSINIQHIRRFLKLANATFYIHTIIIIRSRRIHCLDCSFCWKKGGLLAPLFSAWLYDFHQKIIIKSDEELVWQTGWDQCQNDWLLLHFALRSLFDTLRYATEA